MFDELWGGRGRPPGLLRVATRIAHEPEQSQARRRQFMVSAPKTCYHGSACTIETVITIEPGKRGGKPCIRGLRITVYDVLEYLASGMSERRYSQISRT